jgi:hypothetical protein
MMLSCNELIPIEIVPNFIVQFNILGMWLSSSVEHEIHHRQILNTLLNAYFVGNPYWIALNIGTKIFTEYLKSLEEMIM